jgi:F0F1-type ATP synthase membrane subunit b/b'
MNPQRSLFPTVVLPIAAALVLPAAPAAAAEEGLSIFPEPLPLALLMAFFGALVVPVNLLLVRPLLGTLAERASRIEGARERAASLASEADASLARHRGAIEAARLEAERERRSTLDAARGEQSRLTAAARAESEREIERARGEIRAALAGAREALRRDAQVLARDAVSRILGRPVS